MSIKLTVNLSQEQLNSIINTFTTADNIKPELIAIDDLNYPEQYKRLKNKEQKEHYRAQLLENLFSQWHQQFGAEGAKCLLVQWNMLSNLLDKDGAVIFADLIDKCDFAKLVKTYDDLLQQQGSKSWIHSYINLGNHPEFLGNQDFKNAFLSPLLVTLISYMIGGPLRIVDARGKDAEPISVLAQDNMLHIDNTPFNDEYKVILSWEKGQASGPKGQNFAFLPGTHKGVRNCLADSAGNVWSTENASIFITDESIENAFNFQLQNTTYTEPTVIEAQHDSKPLSIAFAAGSLIHHRYRTTEKFYARSCVILAFQHSADNPGQLIDPKFLPELAQTNLLYNLLFSGSGGSDDFIAAVAANATNIAEALLRIGDLTDLIIPTERKLDSQQLALWKEHATQAPTVDNLKKKNIRFPLHAELQLAEFYPLLEAMMFFDKHGPLDLILYSDNHEESRKWARNRIREMSATYLKENLYFWQKYIKAPEISNLLSKEEITAICNSLINHLKAQDISALNLMKTEKITPAYAIKSLCQLTTDLNEFILRCDTKQAFLSTSLFLFWVVNETILLTSNTRQLIEFGRQLLNHYIVCYILVEMYLAAYHVAS